MGEILFRSVFCRTVPFVIALGARPSFMEPASSAFGEQVILKKPKRWVIALKTEQLMSNGCSKAIGNEKKTRAMVAGGSAITAQSCAMTARDSACEKIFRETKFLEY